MAARLISNLYLSFLCVLLSISYLYCCKNKQPHIVFMLVDDLGWFDVASHGAWIDTSNIDSLSREGIVLDNYYVQPICTPTRSSLMTGLYPIHTGMQHDVIYPPAPYGLPLNLTLLPEKLKELGYSTHIVGKWHLGFYKWDYTPTFRGFETFLGFYSGSEYFYTHKFFGYLDFRDGREIARQYNGTYATDIYTMRATTIIETHNPAKPLFLYLPFQNVHGPLEVPKEFIEKYSFISDKNRRIHVAKVDYVDKAIGSIIKTLKDKNLWEDTLLIFSTDNGGIHLYGGYNWPLRGEKKTLWEGGVRGFAFVSGGWVPQKGVVRKQLLHVTDWYPTLIHLAGGSVDKDKESLDGFNVWKTIANGDPSPRTEILLNIDLPSNGSASPSYEGIALRMGDMKLMLKVPNSTWYIPPELSTMAFGKASQKFDDILELALYNITADPTEHVDLSGQLPHTVQLMKSRIKDYMKTVVPPLNKPYDPKGYAMAKKKGAWSPWE